MSELGKAGAAARPMVAMSSFRRGAIGTYLLFSFIIQIVLLFQFWPITVVTDGAPAWNADYQLLVLWQDVISPEGRVMVLVLVAGGLGGTAHGVRSFVFYIGHGLIANSWTWWYLMRPIGSSVLAILFHFVFNGGFAAGLGSSGASTEIAAENLEGKLAISVAVAGLVGMFSDQAFQKLKEIAETIFSPPRKDAPAESVVAAPTITRIVPETLIVDGADKTVRLLGQGFVEGVTVTVDDRPVASKRVNDLELDVTLPAVVLQPGQRLKFVVENAQARVKSSPKAIKTAAESE